MKFHRFSVFHPFLFAVYPTLFILSHNLGQSLFRDCLTPTLWIMGGALAGVIILSGIFRNMHKAGIIVTAFLILFFSFGHVFEAILNLKIINFEIGRYRYLVLLWIFLLCGVFFACWRTKRDLSVWTRALNGIGLFLVLWNAGNIFLFQINHPKAVWEYNQAAANLRGEEAATGDKSQKLPDIYYIILDGYARTDVLKELYGYDNQRFLRFLDERGFRVFNRSTANYPRTHLSLASSLNFQYLDEMVEKIGNQSADERSFYDMIRENKARHFLKQQGYTFISLSSGYTATEIRDADIYINFPKTLNEFERILLHSTPIAWIQPATTSNVWYSFIRNKILSVLEYFPKIAQRPEPTFALVHIVSPHWPYVFDRDGNKIDPKKSTFINPETKEDPAIVELNKKRYVDQLIFITDKIMEKIDEVIKSSSSPPVMILQSDHGPGILVDWLKPDNVGLKERMSILNAVYLPGADYEKAGFYEEVTPVNTFPLLFNYYFKADMKLKEDQNYFSPSNAFLDFVDVTARVKEMNQIK